MTTLTRRHILQTSVAALALTSVPCLAFAHSHSDQLLADILIGVGDALQREWIRDNYGHGQRRTPVHTAGIPRLLAFALPAAGSAATSVWPAAAPSGTRTAPRRSSRRLETGRSRSGPRSEISCISMILSRMVKTDVLGVSFTPTTFRMHRCTCPDCHSTGTGPLGLRAADQRCFERCRRRR